MDGMRWDVTGWWLVFDAPSHLVKGRIRKDSGREGSSTNEASPR